MLLLWWVMGGVAVEEAALQKLQVSDTRIVFAFFLLKRIDFGEQRGSLVLELLCLFFQLEHICFQHVYVVLHFCLLAALADLQ